MVKPLALLVCLSSCATGLTVVGALGNGGWDKHEHESKVSMCGTAHYIAGMLIDAVAVAGDIGMGDAIDGWDAALFIPVGLDVIFATALEIGCLTD